MNDTEAIEWRLTWGEHTMAADEWTVAHALLVREALDLSGPAAWQSLSPVTDPRTCAAFLAVLIHTASGVDLDAAVDEVFRAPASALVAALTVNVPDTV